MLTECSGWDYYSVLIFGPTAALAKVLLMDGSLTQAR